MLCPTNCVSCTMDTGSCTQCSPGYYGSACSPCPEHCVSDTCSMTDGSCSPCTAGYYGSRCSDVCSPHCDGASCHQDSGVCDGDCIIGFSLPQCTNTYPDGCLDSCDRANVACHSCKPGLSGVTCDKPCPANCVSCTMESGSCTQCSPGYYGSVCSPCPEHCASDTCSMTDGSCSPCTAGNYGSRCSDVCSPHCDGASCHQNSGVCDSDCISGFYLPQCTNTCPDGCLDSCDRANAACDSCRSGLSGVTCDKPCPANCKDSICTVYRKVYWLSSRLLWR